MWFLIYWLNSLPSSSLLSNLNSTLKSSLKNIPLARWGEPEDIGHTACFLASEKAGYITGQMITVDGGIGLS